MCPERQLLRLCLCTIKKEAFSFSKQNYCERRWNQDILTQISDLPLISSDAKGITLLSEFSVSIFVHFIASLKYHFKDIRVFSSV